MAILIHKTERHAKAVAHHAVSDANAVTATVPKPWPVLQQLGW
jgi:DhnA family fructose-bisphosphate aldolase class Ia